MLYKITRLSDDLIFIRWYDSPDPDRSYEFIDDLRTTLDNSSESVYLISDLRFGHISDAGAIQELAKLTAHPRWAGGTAFNGGDVLAGMFAGMFSRVAPDDNHNHQVWQTPSEAFGYLEHLKPGILENIDVALLIDEADPLL